MPDGEGALVTTGAAFAAPAIPDSHTLRLAGGVIGLEGAGKQLRLEVGPAEEADLGITPAGDQVGQEESIVALALGSMAGDC